MATHECKKCLMKTSSNGEIRGSLVTPSSICTAKGHSNEKHHWILVPGIIKFYTDSFTEIVHVILYLPLPLFQ